ncbi:hypothetical protein EVAR_92632_1 [Eumeta japonica]|uniref:Uncharacterized protein n=1 Tax=Eumeta variegata TaxID=151549 RepID=A0A4C1SWQ1_EUMVA|nr:hypothetical protein EVAR_92632_1 [Eumeta japonica]
MDVKPGYYEQNRPETYSLPAQYGTKHAKHTITGSVDNFKNKEKDKGQWRTKKYKKTKMELDWTYKRTNKEKWTKNVVEWYSRNGKNKRGGQIKRWEGGLPKGWRRSTRDREK